MCPMCEKRALMLEQPLADTHSFKTTGPSSTVASYFKNPFKTCKDLTSQCTSPLCESNRISLRGARRSSVRPSTSVPNSGEFPNDGFRLPESPSPEEISKIVTASEGIGPRKVPTQQLSEKKHTSLFRKLKHFTSSSHHGGRNEVRQAGDDSSRDSGFDACGKKVIHVVRDLEQEDNLRGSPTFPSSNPLYVVAETELDTISELTPDRTETNVSETTMISMMNLNGSFSSPCASFHGTLVSSTFDDDASSFAIVPRTSINSSRQDWASDASGLSARFGDLDIGYLSLEESGEAPEFDDTVSISSAQPDDVDLNLHREDDTISETNFEQEFSLGTDSNEWVTETEDGGSILQRSSQARSNDLNSSQTQQLHSSVSSTSGSFGSRREFEAEEKKKTEVKEVRTKSTATKKSEVKPAVKEKFDMKPTETRVVEVKPTGETCSHIGQEEQPEGNEATMKKCTKKENPMSVYFHTYMKGNDHAVVAAKVVVLLGKYGNRKGLRVAGLPPTPKELQKPAQNFPDHELDRLKRIMMPKSDAVTAFQNEVARMMLEGVDVPALNMDVEQFLAGYTKLNSPFYIELIEEFFKSVCFDCFGQMGEIKGDPYFPELPCAPSTRPGHRKRASRSSV